MALKSRDQRQARRANAETHEGLRRWRGRLTWQSAPTSLSSPTLGHLVGKQEKRAVQAHDCSRLKWIATDWWLEWRGDEQSDPSSNRQVWPFAVPDRLRILSTRELPRASSR